MRLNRITFSIDSGILDTRQIKPFNQFASYYEELIFKFLPKNTNVGGYGFINTKLELTDGGADINAYGQIVKASLPVTQNELMSLLTGTIQEKVSLLGICLTKVINTVGRQVETDTQKIETAILEANKNHLGFEQELKVSKSHKSRALKVIIVRVVKPDKVFITCRIIHKNGGLAEEVELLGNSTVYDAAYHFKKSRWNANKLLIFDRFGEEKYSIDVAKHLG